MALRRVKLAEVKAFDYAFEPPIRARMADVGRTLGSQTIGLAIQTVPPGCFSSRKHRHVFQEEILLVMSGSGLLHHGAEKLAVAPGDCFCYLPEDAEAHCFENTGASELVIWAFGNRFPHEVCLYPEQGVAFVEGLGADVPLAEAVASAWTEEQRRKR